MTGDPQQAAQDALYAGLDALLATVPLDLCAYLHLPSAAGPQLFLRRPDLGTLEAGDAFTLFTALRDAVNAEHPEIPGYFAVFVPSAGPGSRGLHAFGRRDGKLDDRERATAEAICRATGTVAHALEPGTERVEPHRVAVEIRGDLVSAEVEVLAGDNRLLGRAEQDTPHEAVASAALDALGTGYSLAAARAVDLADEKAAVVLIEGAGARRLGSVLYRPDGDPLFAFAAAALEAAERVPTMPR